MKKDKINCTMKRKKEKLLKVYIFKRKVRKSTPAFNGFFSYHSHVVSCSGDD